MKKNKTSWSKTRKIIAVVLTFAVLLSSLGVGLTVFADSAKKVIYTDDYKIEKISNPTHGEGEADGIVAGGDRMNSYSWAMEERNGYLYIGTNRNLLGEVIDDFAKLLTSKGLTYDQVWDLVDVITNGEIPRYQDEEMSPMIIRLDPETGEVKVIFQDEVGVDAGYRVAINYHGDLYFGSMNKDGGTRLIRVDEEENVEPVYTSGGNTSMRAAAVYNDKLYFGGLDGRISDEETQGKYNKIAVMEMNPENPKEWNRVADFTDFIDYADDQLYAGAGGAVWDLVSYNGDMYMFLGTSKGFVLFKGHEAKEGEKANKYGWNWTEVIGKNSEYNMGMAPTPEGYDTGDGMSAGLIASLASPVIYNDKMYFGTFDYSLRVVLTAVQGLMTMVFNPDNAPSLKEIFGPMYTTLNAPQKFYCMDKDGKITEVDGLNSKIENTTNEYIWRYAIYNDKLFVTIFDSTPLYNYVTKLSNGDLLRMDEEEFRNQINHIVEALKSLSGVDLGIPNDVFIKMLEKPTKTVAELLGKPANVENTLKLINALEKIEDALKKIEGIFGKLPLAETRKAGDLLGTVKALMSKIDLEGLRMYLEICQLMQENIQGFDLYVSEDGENFEPVVLDGFGDKFNYGGRTIVSTSHGLYIGTANPYYGTQVWRLTEIDEEVTFPGHTDPETSTDDTDAPSEPESESTTVDETTATDDAQVPEDTTATDDKTPSDDAAASDDADAAEGEADKAPDDVATGDSMKFASVAAAAVIAAGAVTVLRRKRK